MNQTRESVTKQNVLFRIVILVSCIPFAFGKGNSEATKNYEKSLKQINSGNLNVDFKALRLNCSDSKYSCEAGTGNKAKLRALFKEKKFKEALKEADKALKKAFVDIDMHFFAYIANTELQNKDKAEFHKIMINYLIDSIRENKHGRSEKDAFVVINVDEENAFLRFSKMQVMEQKLIFKDGHSYDVIKCMDMDLDKDLTLYFNVDIPLKNLNDLLKDANKQ
jgi:hypothetical protein